MKRFGRKLNSVYHMPGAVAQWLVRATDDRVVAGSNPRVAASKLGTSGKFVYELPHIACVLRE